MSQSSNVVNLEVKRGARSKTPKLPTPLVKLRERCGAHLSKLIDRFFERVDDTFFDLADQAASNAEQTSYFDAMREVRLQRNVMTKSFLGAYRRAFEFKPKDLGATTVDADFNADNLSLVQNDDLEEQVAVENIVKRIINEVGQDLEHLTLRLNVLLPDVKLEDEDNPLGAQCLANGFAQACGNLEMDIRSRIVLYKLFEKQVLSQVKSMLAAANKYLVEQGVMPDLNPVKRVRTYSAPPVPPQTNNASVIDGETGSVTGEVQGELSPEFQVDPMVLMAQMHQQLPNFNQGYEHLNLPELRQPTLVNALSKVQHRSSLPADGNGLVNFVMLLQRMLQDKEGNARAAVGQVDQNAMNLVSMLFEFILEDRQLQAPIKAILGRLQIPLVKVALMDRTFFNKGGHVARRLLNEMAMASIGWVEGKKAGADRFLDKLEECVLRIVNEFEDDLVIFEEVLDDFLAFHEADKKRRILVEQRTRDSEEGRAKSEAAKRFVQSELNGLLLGHTVADSVLGLLREGWSNYMVLLVLRKGEEHESVKAARKLAATLISAASEQTELEPLPQDRIGSLVAELKLGLQQTSFMPFELEKVVKELSVHLTEVTEQRKLRLMPEPKQNLFVGPAGLPSITVEEEVFQELPEENSLLSGPLESSLEESESIVDGSFDLPELEEEQDEALPVEEAKSTILPSSLVEQTPQEETHVDQVMQAKVAGGMIAPTPRRKADAPVVESSPAPIQLVEDEPEQEGNNIAPEVVERIDRMGIGAWVEMREDVDKRYRCKLAAIIHSTGKYIFVNRMGVKVSEKTRGSLAKAIQEKDMVLLDDGLLFDRALESVISNLRER